VRGRPGVLLALAPGLEGGALDGTPGLLADVLGHLGHLAGDPPGQALLLLLGGTLLLLVFVLGAGVGDDDRLGDLGRPDVRLVGVRGVLGRLDGAGVRAVDLPHDGVDRVVRLDALVGRHLDVRDLVVHENLHRVAGEPPPDERPAAGVVRLGVRGELLLALLELHPLELPQGPRGGPLVHPGRHQLPEDRLRVPHLAVEPHHLQGLDGLPRGFRRHGLRGLDDGEGRGIAAGGRAVLGGRHGADDGLDPLGLLEGDGAGLALAVPGVELADAVEVLGGVDLGVLVVVVVAPPVDGLLVVLVLGEEEALHPHGVGHAGGGQQAVVRGVLGDVTMAGHRLDGRAGQPQALEVVLKGHQAHGPAAERDDDPGQGIGPVENRRPRLRDMVVVGRRLGGKRPRAVGVENATAGGYDQDMKISGVYAIRHAASGRACVGSSSNIGGRWRLHRSLLRRGVHHSPRLQRTWDKYGEAAFEWVVLEQSLDPGLLYGREQVFLDAHFEQGLALNVSRDATDFARGAVLPAWWKAKIAAKLRGNKNGAGARHPKVKEADVPAVLKRVAAGDSMAAIAADLGVHRVTVRRIANGVTFPHIHPGEADRIAIERRRRTRRPGSRHPNAKLTEADVLTIRARLAAGETPRAVALDYQVTVVLVGQIRDRKAWRHI
jgi:hypothetical protein